MTQVNRLRFSGKRNLAQSKVARKFSQAAAKIFKKKWIRLQKLCPDLNSQHRLLWLQQKFSNGHRGAMESAQAEIDIATFLGKAGFTLYFVKETEARTADLECYLGYDRLFVEVTVIVPMSLDRFKGSGSSLAEISEDGSVDFLNNGLVKRILPRMKKKAAQLANYCSPVILALTLVNQEQKVLANGKNSVRKVGLGFQQLGGVITNALVSVPQLSGVLLTLWNIQTAESQPTIRLSNVHVGEWVVGRSGGSQVRSLVLNPSASCMVESGAQNAIIRIL